MKKFVVIVLCLAALAGILFLNTQKAKESGDYKNALYLVDGKRVKLDGKAFTYLGDEMKGDLNGDGHEDIVFYITADGGDGRTFYYITAALNEGNQYTGTNAIFIGDNITPQPTQIVSGEIVVNFVPNGNTEPTSRRFRALGDTLMNVYRSSQYGISFLYPDSHIFQEREIGTKDNYHFVVTIIHKRDAVPVVNGEGPTGITIEVVENHNTAFSLVNWLKETSFSNFKLSNGTYASTTVDGQEALTYHWSGLYEGLTTAFSSEGKVVTISVTSLTAENENTDAYETILDSFRIEP